ncbi:hypothetical protein [Demequina sp. NBRC 110055]|uniref:hypothetical protein n=1 Tax=Demequina sp. NBRC 110055 TaxID=1570344 RepID=UPI001185D106|nr:hypothetical protein [Demequina sp. NBRC 110055]
MRATARLGRAAVAATVATGVALGSHVLGGGAMPSAPGVLVPLALSFAVCVQLAGRTVSWWRTGVGVAASQALFHALFVLGAGGVTVTAATHAHHLEAGALTVPAGAHGGHGGGVMSIAHVVAALVTTAALVRLDWALASAGAALDVIVAALVRNLAAPRASAPSAGHTAALCRIPALRPLVLASGSGLRGPPVR